MEPTPPAAPPADPAATSPVMSSRPPVGHPDYEFPKEVHNLLVTAQSNHLALSEMADSKASILMGATFVVFTLTIGEIMQHKATASLLLLAGFSFAATILSVLAVRPNMRKPPSEYQPGLNLLFFGSFAGLDEEKYIDRIIGILRSEEDTYRTMARDLFQNGKFMYLSKYRYLTQAYTVFLIGLMATLIAFVIELVLK
ncbi:MAG: Pycsar system effector family protein [Sphingobium sp.]